MPVLQACRLLERLLNEGREKSWLEFKLNNADPDDIGKYISALANSAVLHDKDRAFLVFGVEDSSLRKVGTQVKLASIKVGNEGFQNWLARLLEPSLKIEFHDFDCEGLTFSIIEIEPSYYMPVQFKGQAYIRLGEHTKKLADHPEHARSLWLATSRRSFENAIALTNVSQSDLPNVLDLLL
jgi:ATP-dependent DNA helicase RecG